MEEWCCRVHSYKVWQNWLAYDLGIWSLSLRKLDSSNLLWSLWSGDFFFSHISCTARLQGKVVSSSFLFPIFLLNISLSLKILPWDYLYFLPCCNHLQNALIPLVFLTLPHCHSYQHHFPSYFLGISITTWMTLVDIELLDLLFVNLFRHLMWDICFQGSINYYTPSIISTLSVLLCDYLLFF